MAVKLGSLTFFMKVEIKISFEEAESSDEPNPFDCIIKADMQWKSVHDWFALFEKVLKMAGFCDFVIMKGGCELAFSEGRSTKDMLKVADEYDLVMKEFLVKECIENSKEIVTKTFGPQDETIDS